MESIPGIVKERVRNANSITVLTGAGISADCGIPTFRGNEGLWKNFKAEELATPGAFKRNPRLVWEWYNWRRELIASKQPGRAHYALVELEKRVPSFTLITQNVDGLHKKAGSRNLIEMHGNIWKVRCTSCNHVKEDHRVPIEILPYCDRCGGLLRPHIVWFGESINPEDLGRSMEALKNCEVFMVIGTSGVVHPAASFMSIAKEGGAFIVEINLEETPNSYLVDAPLRGRASEIVPQLL